MSSSNSLPSSPHLNSPCSPLVYPRPAADIVGSKSKILSAPKPPLSFFGPFSPGWRSGGPIGARRRGAETQGIGALQLMAIFPPSPHPCGARMCVHYMHQQHREGGGYRSWKLQVLLMATMATEPDGSGDFLFCFAGSSRNEMSRLPGSESFDLVRVALSCKKWLKYSSFFQRLQQILWIWLKSLKVRCGNFP